MSSLEKYWALLVMPALILAACAGEAYEGGREAGAVLPVAATQATAAEPDTWSGQDPYDDEDYSQVEKGLYCGGRVREPPPGTEAVLCLCEEVDPYRKKVKSWRYEAIPDGGPAPPVAWLKEQVAYIAAQRKAGRQVYVHCWAGISRGPMVTTAYLMWEHHWSRDKALEFLLQQRPEISPNMYFMDLLSDWEDALKTGPATQGAGTGK